MSARVSKEPSRLLIRMLYNPHGGVFGVLLVGVLMIIGVLTMAQNVKHFHL